MLCCLICTYCTDEANCTALPKLNRLASASQQLTTNILTRLTEPKQVTYQTEPSRTKHNRANTDTVTRLGVVIGQLGISNTNIILCRNNRPFMQNNNQHIKKQT